MTRGLVHANLRQWYRLNEVGVGLSHDLAHPSHRARTMRYNVLPCSSVKSRMSLHKNTRNLRPLFALFRRPSLSSFRSPKCRVGAVRSSRLSGEKMKRAVSEH